MSEMRSNVRWNNEGYTFMDQEKMDILMNQIKLCDEKEEVSISDLIPKDASPLSEIPIRTASNAPEHFGGMRMDGIRGQGDTVCRTENMRGVYNEILENQLIHIRDILSYAAMDPYKIKLEYNSYLINRFLDLYDQPIPVNLNHALKDLKIPEAECDYRRYDRTQFEFCGRDSVWARGLEFACLEWESEYAMDKRTE